MNTVILKGRLVDDPKPGKEGRTIRTSFYALAVDRFKRPNDKTVEADFIPCVVFDKAAEFADNWLKKGMLMLVTGHLQTSSYKDKEGKTVKSWNVVVDRQEFCESRPQKEKAAVETGRPAFKEDPGFLDIPMDNLDEEGLPFK